jgi:hypothetical protein
MADNKPMYRDELTPNDLQEVGNTNAVLVALTIYQLEGLVPAESKFYAECCAHLWWLEPEPESKAETEARAELKRKAAESEDKTCHLEKAEWDQFKLHVPTLYFENARGTLENVCEPFVLFDGNNNTCHMERRVRGEFHEYFELHNFPFDVQACAITLRINSKADIKLKRYMAKNAAYSSNGAVQPYLLPNMKCLVSEAEWHTYEPVCRIGSDSANKPRMQYQAHAIIRRRSEFFVKNVMLVNFIICSLAFAAFAVPVSATPEGGSTDDVLDQRGAIVLTLTLTTVAFKFVVSDSLPRISYSTALDFYMNSSFYLLALLFAWSAMIVAVPWEEEDSSAPSVVVLSFPQQPPPSAPPPPASPSANQHDAGRWTRQQVDHLFGLCVAGLWLLFNAATFLLARIYIMRARALLGKEKRLAVSDSRAPTSVHKVFGVSMFPRWCSAGGAHDDSSPRSDAGKGSRLQAYPVAIEASDGLMEAGSPSKLTSSNI